jgi:hypothetical protein
MKEIYNVFKDEFGKHGYRTQGSRSWKVLHEIVAIAQVVRSQWQDAYYIEIGVLPTTFMRKSVAPHVDVCQDGCRATDLSPSPYIHVYRNLQTDGKYEEQQLRRSIAWLTKWIHLHYGDIDELRMRFLMAPRDEEDVPPNEPFFANNIMIDWAMGQLRPPEFYYPDRKW